MKNKLITYSRRLYATALIAAISITALSLTACDNGTTNGGNPDLNGTITISPTTATTGTELTATYSGSEAVTYQWKNGTANVGTNSNKHTPSTAGSYTVTVSAAGCNPKTSAAVTVTGAALPDLSGTIAISPTTATTGTELTATYSGSETVTYQWKNGTANVGTNSNKHTPSTAGSYTVTVSAAGYSPKTSAAVTVTGATLRDLKGDITISPTTATTGTQLAAYYSGSETVTYQWKNGAANVGTNSNKYTPTQEGNYTVTVSAAGYSPKTSAAVTVTLRDLSGTISIGYPYSSETTVTTGTELTAYYSKSETVTYQWKKDGSNVGTNSRKYTPTTAGSYTVTVSATGYNPKTSAAVTVIELTAVGRFAYSYINAIAYGNGKFVAVGKEGKMATSPDGKNWTDVADSTFGDTSIGPIAWGNGTFVAVGGGKMATSSDGITWTAGAASTIGGPIAWGNGTFVAVDTTRDSTGGWSGKVATSPDGVTWTAGADSTFGNLNIIAIAWGNDKFVAVGIYGKMATSPDGVTWTAVADSTFSDHYIIAIAWGNGTFVAAGNTGSGVGKIATSPDGVTWTAVADSTFGKSTINAIAYGNNKFVAIGEYSKMATSPDGTTWTAIASNGTFLGSDILCIIAYDSNSGAGNKFVVVSDYGYMAYLSDN